MRLFEIAQIEEDPVESSWLQDLSYDEKTNNVIMSTRRDDYVIYNVPFETYQGWVDAGSKGTYFHRFIKNNYRILPK